MPAMKTIRTILHPTDFSQSSVAAADYALTLARLAGAGVHVLHVLAEFEDRRKRLIQPQAFEIMEREVEVHALQETEAYGRERFPAEVSCTTQVVLGVPFRRILECAEACSADLIVMGTHGHSGLDRAVVGSTAERVVRGSRIPVLIVRRDDG